MQTYGTVLFLHVIATLGLVCAMSVEGLALRQLRRASSSRRDLTYWLDPWPMIRLFGAICLVLLFFTGGYLAERASLWKVAWPKIAVFIVVAFGMLAGQSSRRFKKLRQLCTKPETPDAELLRKLRAPFFTVSLSVRVGLTLAAVLLMTAKAELGNSVWIVLAMVMIFWGLAAPLSGPQKFTPSLGPEVDHSR